MNTVIAWLWARTVKSPNPAYSHVDVPLITTFVLSSKQGKEAYVHPVVEGDEYRFTVKLGQPPADAEEGTKAVGRGANFRCLLSDSPIGGDYIKAEGQAGRIGARLLAMVVESAQGRGYVAPIIEHENIAAAAAPEWKPAGDVPSRLTGGTCVTYGMREWGDLFTSRQLVALTSFSDLAREAQGECLSHAAGAGYSADERSLDEGGLGAKAYSEAIGLYLAFCVDKMSDTNTSLCSWQVNPPRLRATFGRQALPMVWDFAEANVFGDAAGDFQRCVGSLTEVLDGQIFLGSGHAFQADATEIAFSEPRIVSTDPPYYNNIAYADLSDFFYVWLRRMLRQTFPEMLATLTVPKADELVATPYRHGGKDEAENFFLQGMTKAMSQLAEQGHSGFPVTIYYAFKQSETSSSAGTTSSGWETFLSAVMRSGFAITGTWPFRSELASRNVGRDNNALASSIVLVCRKRDDSALTVSRREFLRELHSVLPDALVDMTRGGVNSPVQPVDLSQAIIGPGMGIFSKYKAVLEADGNAMSVRTALQLINRFLADDEFDEETQFCLQWVESYGWKPADYGSADTLAQAKGAVLSHMHRDGILISSGGIVQLIRWQELNVDWTPEKQNSTPIWQALHQLIASLQAHGEQSTGALLASMPAVSGRVRTLAYRLYTLAERKGLAEDARPYNELIGAWSAIELAAAEVGPIETQAELF